MKKITSIFLVFALCMALLPVKANHQFVASSVTKINDTSFETYLALRNTTTNQDTKLSSQAFTIQLVASDHSHRIDTNVNVKNDFTYVVTFDKQRLLPSKQYIATYVQNGYETRLWTGLNYQKQNVFVQESRLVYQGEHTSIFDAQNMFVASNITKVQDDHFEAYLAFRHKLTQKDRYIHGLAFEVVLEASDASHVVSTTMHQTSDTHYVFHFDKHALKSHLTYTPKFKSAHYQSYLWTGLKHDAVKNYRLYYQSSFNPKTMFVASNITKTTDNSFDVYFALRDKQIQTNTPLGQYGFNVVLEATDHSHRIDTVQEKIDAFTYRIRFDENALMSGKTYTPKFESAHYQSYLWTGLNQANIQNHRLYYETGFNPQTMFIASSIQKMEPHRFEAYLAFRNHQTKNDRKITNYDFNVVLQSDDQRIVTTKKQIDDFHYAFEFDPNALVIGKSYVVKFESTTYHSHLWTGLTTTDFARVENGHLYYTYRYQIQETTHFEVIPITETYVESEILLLNQTQVLDHGEAGSMRIHRTITKLNGDVISNRVFETVERPMRPKVIARGTKIITPHAKVVTRTIYIQDDEGNQLSEPIVDKLFFAKTTWTNNDRVVWENAKRFAPVRYPQINGFEKPRHAGSFTFEANHQSTDIIAHIVYERKQETPLSQVELFVKYGYLSGDTVYIFKSDQTPTLFTIQGNEVTSGGMKIRNIDLSEQVFEGTYLKSAYTFKKAYIKETAIRDGIAIKENEVLVLLQQKPLNIDAMFTEVFAMSEEERYVIAKTIYTTENANHIMPIKEGGLRQSDIQKITRYFDRAKYQQAFLKLVNDERVRMNRPILTLNPELDRGAQIRADEQAAIGYLRSHSKPHWRPNNTSWETAFTYLTNSTISGENILQDMAYNLEFFISEKYLAEKHFTQFKNSEGHYQNMISPLHRGISFAISFMDMHQLIQGGPGHSSIAVQAFSR